MGFIKYVLELIVIFYIVRMGIRFIDSIFRPSVSASGKRKSTTKWEGYTEKEPRVQPKADDYIDYEEVKK